MFSAVQTLSEWGLTFYGISILSRSATGGSAGGMISGVINQIFIKLSQSLFRYQTRLSHRTEQGRLHPAASNLPFYYILALKNDGLLVPAEVLNQVADTALYRPSASR